MICGCVSLSDVHPCLTQHCRFGFGTEGVFHHFDEANPHKAPRLTSSEKSRLPDYKTVGKQHAAQFVKQSQSCHKEGLSEGFF